MAGFEHIGEANRNVMIQLMVDNLPQEELDAIFVGLYPHVSPDAFEKARNRQPKETPPDVHRYRVLHPDDAAPERPTPREE